MSYGITWMNQQHELQGKPSKGYSLQLSAKSQCTLNMYLLGGNEMRKIYSRSYLWLRICITALLAFNMMLWSNLVVYAATYRYPTTMSPTAPTSTDEVEITVKSDPVDGEYGPALEYRIGGNTTEICPDEHPTCTSSGIGGELSGQTTWTFSIPAQSDGTLIEYQLFNRNESGSEYGHTGFNWGYYVDDDSQTYHSIYADGVIDFGSNENSGSDNGVTYYFSWDSSNFFVLFDGGTVTSDRYNIAFDTDPGGTSGSGGCWGGSTFPLYGRPDHIIQFSGDSASVLHGVPNGISTWNGAGSTNGIIAKKSSEGNIVEVQIPRSLVGLSNSSSEVSIYFWVGYADGAEPYDCATEEFTFSYLPDENDTSGSTTVTPIMGQYFSNTGSGETPNSGWQHQLNLHSSKALTAVANDQYHDVILDSGTTLTGPASGTMYVSGDWNGTGGFAHNNSTVQFNGTDAQEIGNSRAGTGRRFNNITVSGTGGLTSQYSVDLIGDLTVASSSGGMIAKGDWEFELSNSKALDCDTTCDFQDDLIVRTVDASGSTATLNIDSNFSIATSSSSFTAPATMSVGGNWTNDGTYDADGGAVTFDGSGEQTVAGSSTTAFNNVTISDNTTVTLSTEPTVAESLTNYGTLKQTATVNNDNFAFLEIDNGSGTIKYRGVDISTSANLGSVTVAVENADTDSGEYCTTTGAGSPTYTERCYEISSDSDGAATIRLYTLNTTDELNSIPVADLAIYHDTGGGIWQTLTNGSTGTTGAYAYAEGDTNSFSSFLLADNDNAPTAITLSDLSARASSPALLVASVLLLGMAILWQRKRA